MAITPTPNNSLFKGFVFDGVDSRDYGVYISGDAVFNAPERDVEMIEIPGRNGAFALDKGRFSNIEVTYPAGLFGATEADFAAGINALRNALASRKGYCRLEDDYNPNEYRMAVYKSGLDVTPAMLKAGEFDIVFECKPQRFLKLGETAVTVTSGGTITNPTLFESSPLLQADGYGQISINGDSLSIYNLPLGKITLPYTVGINDPVLGLTYNYDISNTNFLNQGDEILFTSRKLYGAIYAYFSGVVEIVSGENFTENITSAGGVVTKKSYWATSESTVDKDPTEFTAAYDFILKNVPFNYGTASTRTFTVSFTINGRTSSNATRSANISESYEVTYDGDHTIAVNYLAPVVSASITVGEYGFPQYGKSEVIKANSTYSLNTTTYIDLDIGEAYAIEDGQATSLNNVVEIPAELPTLKAGVNTFTYDNTVDTLKVVPRWWEV